MIVSKCTSHLISKFFVILYISNIENLDNKCIHPAKKEKMIQELKQLNHSIAYSSTVLHFSWNIDTITSYKRDRRYSIEDMLCKLHVLLFFRRKHYG